MRRSVLRAALLPQLLLLLLLAAASADPLPGPSIAAAAADEVSAPATAAADVAKEAAGQGKHGTGTKTPPSAHHAAGAEGRYADGEDDEERGGLIADIVSHHGGVSRVRKSCPPFGPCKQFCIEVRPRDPRQSPFIICEPPDHTKNPVPPYPYNPLYPYYPDYEFPYPPAGKDPLLPVPGYPFPPKDGVPPVPVPSYPAYPYPYPPYYKATYPLPYYPVPVPFTAGQNSASSAAATATASTALHGLSGLVPHFRAVDESSSSSADASADSSEKASETAVPASSAPRSVFDPPYQTYVYPPEVPAPCYGDQKYPPLPGVEKPSPVALLQLFLRPSHHHHHHLPPYPLPPPEYRESSEVEETMRHAGDSASHDGDGKSGPMKVDLSLDSSKKTDATVRAAKVTPMYTSQFGPYGYSPVPFTYPGMPYGAYSPYYAAPQAKQSKPDAPAALPPSLAKPAAPADASSPPTGDGKPPSANIVPKGGIGEPAVITAIPDGPPPPSSKPGSSPPAAASTPAKDTPASPATAPTSPSASKPKSASEDGAQPKMAFGPLGLHGYPPQYGYWGQPIGPSHLYNNQYQNYPGLHFGLNL